MNNFSALIKKAQTFQKRCRSEHFSLLCVKREKMIHEADNFLKLVLDYTYR